MKGNFSSFEKLFFWNVHAFKNKYLLFAVYIGIIIVRRPNVIANLKFVSVKSCLHVVYTHKEKNDFLWRGYYIL